MKFMRKLPADVIDCTITSPPYNKMNRIAYNTFDDALPWDEYRSNQIAVLNELYRITKPGGHLWYVHKVGYHQTHIMHPVEWLSKSRWAIRNEITWHRTTCVNVSMYRFRILDERIYWLHKPGPESTELELNPDVSKWGRVWFTPDDRKAIREAFRIHHPATCSLYLMLAILHAMKLPTGSLVYDPYGGSGTTAKACQVSNHYYVTTELDKLYVKLMRYRLTRTVDADEFFILVMIKQIMTNTLDLSQRPRLQDLQRLLQTEPWELPKTRVDVADLTHRGERSKKAVYYRRHITSRRFQIPKSATFTYRPLPARFNRPGKQIDKVWRKKVGRSWGRISDHCGQKRKRSKI